MISSKCDNGSVKSMQLYNKNPPMPEGFVLVCNRVYPDELMKANFLWIGMWKWVKKVYILRRFGIVHYLWIDLSEGFRKYTARLAFA